MDGDKQILWLFDDDSIKFAVTDVIENKEKQIATSEIGFGINSVLWGIFNSVIVPYLDDKYNLPIDWRNDQNYQEFITIVMGKIRETILKLNDKNSVNIKIDSKIKDNDGKNITVNFDCTREILNRAFAELLNVSIGNLQAILNNSHVTLNEIECVKLCGGVVTYTPLQEMIVQNLKFDKNKIECVERNNIKINLEDIEWEEGNNNASPKNPILVHATPTANHITKNSVKFNNKPSIENPASADKPIIVGSSSTHNLKRIIAVITSAVAFGAIIFLFSFSSNDYERELESLVTEQNKVIAVGEDFAGITTKSSVDDKNYILQTLQKRSANLKEIENKLVTIKPPNKYSNSHEKIIAAIKAEQQILLSSKSLISTLNDSELRLNEIENLLTKVENAKQEVIKINSKYVTGFDYSSFVTYVKQYVSLNTDKNNEMSESERRIGYEVELQDRNAKLYQLKELVFVPEKFVWLKDEAAIDGHLHNGSDEIITDFKSLNISVVLFNHDKELWRVDNYHVDFNNVINGELKAHYSIPLRIIIHGKKLGFPASQVNRFLVDTSNYNFTTK